MLCALLYSLGDFYCSFHFCIEKERKYKRKKRMKEEEIEKGANPKSIFLRFVGLEPSGS